MISACSESYGNPDEVTACHFGCSSVSSTKMLCDSAEYQLPQITYSVLIEESDVLIHPGRKILVVEILEQFKN